MASSSFVPPPPNGQVLSLVSALSSPENHDLHVQAIQARDTALSASPESYGNLCLQLAFCLIGSDRPEEMIPRMNPADLEAWRQTDALAVTKLQQHPDQWVLFGQTAGFILKNALLRPPIQPDGRVLSLKSGQIAEQVKESLLYALHCQHAELRAVASSIIATSAVSPDGVQPALYIQSWPRLIPQLLSFLQRDHHNNRSAAVVEGALMTVRKIMEDGPSELSAVDLDGLVPVLVRFLQANQPDTYKIAALQSLVACLMDGMMPSALVVQFDQYMGGLSTLAVDPNPRVRQCVCRNIVTLLDLRTEYLKPYFNAVAQFILKSTADRTHPEVALEACEFWLTFCNLDQEVAVSTEMNDTVAALLPQLVPVLLTNMVYGAEQQAELLAQNELDLQQEPRETVARPVFHKSRALKPGINDENESTDGYLQDDEDDDDDDDDFEAEDGKSWTLRKCAAASLDSLASLYGAEPLLPCLLPVLQEGLSSSDPWIQEASILALGAIADGCHEEMSVHMGLLHPYLMNHLAAPESPATLPQVKSIAAWTIGRYASWAVEQVQTGAQGHLLAQMTEVFLARLQDRNRRVQVACCSAFGVLIETSGDLMAPYLQPMYEQLVAALSRYQGRSLLLLFDVLGTMADCCGPAIAEGELPSIYVPPLLQMWDRIAVHNPEDRTLLPLMESLASTALTSGMNFQPYALQSFENAMCIIEMVTLHLTTTFAEGQLENEEDYDPIICATDLLDGLVEGMTINFLTLVNSSQRYGPHFLTVLHSLCRHEIAGVRMSGLALLGDIARNAPALLEPALPQLLKEAVSSIDPIQQSVCTNAVWATGEICARCQNNPSLVEPFAPELIQNLLGILEGNGVVGARGSTILGLVENASACLGRLAKVSPNLVAPEFPRLLMGWCDGMAKITDATERRDAFEGFLKVVYANPQAIQQATANVSDAIISIIFAIATWHMPLDLPEQPTTLLIGQYNFRPFPTSEPELAKALAQLMRDMKASVGDQVWTSIQKRLPVNVRVLLREAYQL